IARNPQGAVGRFAVAVVIEARRDLVRLSGANLEHRSNLEISRQVEYTGQVEAVWDVEVGTAPFSGRIVAVDRQGERHAASSFRSGSVVVRSRVGVDRAAVEQTAFPTERHMQRVVRHGSGRFELD